MIAKNCYHLRNCLIISIEFFITIGFSVEYENKTDFYNNNNNNNINNNNTFIQNYFKDFLSHRKHFEFNNNKTLFHSINQTLSDLSLNDSLIDTSVISDNKSSLLLQQLLSELQRSESNASASESRTLSSWLGLKRFRRPQFKIKPWISPSQSQQQPQAVHPYPPPQMFPQFLSRPNTFPGPHNPDSLMLPTSLFEESGIKYWLKFIENAGKDDISDSDEYFSRPSNPHEDSRMRRPHNYVSKPLDIGDKPNEENDDFFDENDENDDQSEEDEPNDEPNSSGTHSSHSKQTYESIAPRCDRFTSDICVDDFEYPEQAIVDEIYKRRDIFELMYSEVRDNVPLVDGIPRDVEESYNYDYYNDGKDSPTSSTQHKGSDKKSSPGRGFVCPTEVLYGKPKLARNKKGEWKVIVNAAEFTQTVRMEKCLKPNSKCNYIAYGDYDSRCAQVHSYHRLLVFEKGKGFYIDTFRIPTACTCHVNRKVSYKPIASSSSPGFNNKHKGSAPPLSNTLWSILGGNIPNDGSVPMSQSQELIRNQIQLLQQLKHLPQLSHISPDNVFQQLMDLQSNSESLSVPHKTYPMPQKSNPMSFGQSGIDYIIPGLMVNEEQMNGDRKTMTRPMAQMHQTSGTTTLLNPNVNGAPIVQVIHVPVNSMPQNLDPAPVYKSKPNQSYNDYSYLDTTSVFYKQKPNSEDLLQTFGDDLSHLSDNFKPLLLGMSSKTNSSLMSPKESIKRESDSLGTKNGDSSDETNNKRKVMVENTLNKKINFSYHPILEYISS